MSIPGSASPLFFQTAAADAAAAGPIKSVRFNDADSAYLDKTFSSASNRRTWTWAGWHKRAVDSATNFLFVAGSADTHAIYLNNFAGSATLVVSRYVGSFQVYLETDQVFRDPSAWYHIVVAYDSTQSTASDRIKVYVNGAQVTSFSSSTYPTQNVEYEVNNNVNHRIGRYTDGYLADVYFIDGSALDCTSFGAFDDNGVWQAAAYSGSFGTNGFHLFDFANESGVGDDSSGNDNDFTVNNISEVVPTGSYTVTRGQYTSGVGDGYEPYDAVDGSLSTSYADRGYNNNGLNFSGLPQATQKIRINANLGGGTTSLNANHDSGDPRTFTASATDTGRWKTMSGTVSSSSPYTLTKLTGNGGNNTQSYFAFYAIEIDGVVIVDNRFGKNNDVLRDVPTNGDSSDDTGAGGELSGNYCVLNPLTTTGGNSGTSSAVLSQGNMKSTNPASNSWNVETGTIAVQSGKWYYEFTVSGSVSNFLGGWADPREVNYNDAVGNTARSYGYYSTGNVRNSNNNTGFGSSYAAGDVIGCAIDIDNQKIYWSKNGTFQNSADPAAGTGSIYTIQDPVANNFFYTIAVSTYDSSQSVDINTGQRAFAYTAPSGFKALCTSNLPTPTIADGSAHFESKLYTGNSSTNALTMSNSSMSPDWVWIHSRSTGGDHEMFDIIRGANQVLESNSTNQSNSVSNTLTSFDSNGFTLGSSSLVNDNNVTYVAYAWDGGSSSVTNTSGSINSTVRANADAGFSIVKWTGSGSAETVGHGLGAKPHFIISHRISGSGQWPTYNAEIGATKYMYFNSTIEARTYQHFWNNTEPTSSVFSIGTDADVSLNGGTHIAYCFAPVEDYQAMGKYVGTGSSPGAFVYTGFKPALVMIKRITVAESWVFYDTSRDTHNPTTTRAWADLNYGDSTNTSHFIDIHSNGFTVRSGGGLLGASGHEYFYWAIAENPFQANGGLAR